MKSTPSKLQIISLMFFAAGLGRAQAQGFANTNQLRNAGGTNSSHHVVCALRGDGSGVSNVNAAALGGLGSAAFWQLNGNAGTSPGSDVIGTTDNTPLQLHVNGYRALRLEPNDGQPNIIAGTAANAIEAGGTGGSAISGGDRNRIAASADHSSIGGGFANQIQSSSSQSFIGGGEQNLVQLGADHSTIGGGIENRIESGAAYAVIGGGSSNTVQFDVHYSTISGGRDNSIRRDADYSAITGGGKNTIEEHCSAAAIAGGSGNSIGAGSHNSFIAGGYLERIESGCYYAAISGGNLNLIQSLASFSAIGGGQANRIQSRAGNTFIGGGSGNDVQSDADHSAIGGGLQNAVETGAAGAAIGGGESNTVQGAHGTIPGGLGNSATNLSFAAGHLARACNAGSFVWADSQTTPFSSTANDQVSFRCQGGVVFASGANTVNQTVSWEPGTAGWSFSSDRNLKERVTPVDAQSVLAGVARLPLAEWSYKGFEQRHIGPMAQDFHALFPLNDDDKTLNDADLHGVALAAIQALNQKLQAQLSSQAAEMKRKEAELQDLRKDLAKLTARVSRLESVSNASNP